MIDMKKCVCLNESKQHPLKDALSPLQGYLESDSGPQVAISDDFSNITICYINACARNNTEINSIQRKILFLW